MSFRSIYFNHHNGFWKAHPFQNWMICIFFWQLHFLSSRARHCATQAFDQGFLPAATGFSGCQGLRPIFLMYTLMVLSWEQLTRYLRHLANATTRLV